VTGARFPGADFTAFFAGFPAAGFPAVSFTPEAASFLVEALTSFCFDWLFLPEASVAVARVLMEECAGSIGRICGGLASRRSSASAVMEGPAI
jgi:hypothetical protein